LHALRKEWLPASASGRLRVLIASISTLSGLKEHPSILTPLTADYSERTLAGFPIRTRTYNASFPGPVFVTRPGHLLQVRLNNRLPREPLAQPPPGIDAENNPSEFNTTALHFHGLQVIPHLFSPIGTSDPSARMVAVRCGESVTYNFICPRIIQAAFIGIVLTATDRLPSRSEAVWPDSLSSKARSTRFQKSRRPATCPPHTVRLVTERRAGNGTEPVPTGI
jgi:hypothetical protein